MNHLCRVGLLLILLIGFVAPAGAHGGTVRVNEDSGAYHIIAATGPGNQPEEVRLTVVLATRSTGDNDAITPVQGVTVTATLQLTNGVAALVNTTLPPEPTLAEFGYYEQVLTLPQEGNWRVIIGVTGAGAASVVTAKPFPLFWQRPPAEVSWIGWAIALLLVVITVGFLVYTRRRHGGTADREKSD